MDEFDRDMRRVAARSAIAHRKQLPMVTVDVRQRPRGGDKGVGLAGEKALVGFACVARLLLYRMHERGVELRRILRLAMQEGIEGLETGFAGHGSCPLNVRRIGAWLR